MAEKLYTIPVNEAFETNCECPVCEMRRKIEQSQIEFTLGPSYMEDDVRGVTDKTGFCSYHINKLYGQQNRLGLALIMESHLRKTVNRLAKEAKDYKPSKPGLFGKKTEGKPALLSDLSELKYSCFVCNRVNDIFERYIATIFHLFVNDRDFSKKLSESKGFCFEHCELLLSEAPKALSGSKLDEFNNLVLNIFIDNLKRVDEDLDWFIKKFDYRYADEPWKESKDAVQRAILKINSETVQ